MLPDNKISGNNFKRHVYRLHKIMAKTYNFKTLVIINQ